MGNVCLIALLPIALFVGILFVSSRILQFFCVSRVRGEKNLHEDSGIIMFSLIMGVNFNVIMAGFLFLSKWTKTIVAIH